MLIGGSRLPLTIDAPTQRHWWRLTKRLRNRDKLAIDDLCQRSVPENLCWCDRALVPAGVRLDGSPKTGLLRGDSVSHMHSHFAISRGLRLPSSGKNGIFWPKYDVNPECILRHSAIDFAAERILSGSFDHSTSHTVKLPLPNVLRAICGTPHKLLGIAKVVALTKFYIQAPPINRL